MKESKFSVKRSSAGLGLFANVHFKKNEFIIEYTGQKLTDEEADKKGGKYLFKVKKNLTIDGTDRKNLSRYLNHSCCPNCEALQDGDKIVIHAKKKIQPGEELTYDYGKEYFNEFIKPHGCHCQKCQKNKKTNPKK